MCKITGTLECRRSRESDPNSNDPTIVDWARSRRKNRAAFAHRCFTRMWTKISSIIAGETPGTANRHLHNTRVPAACGATLVRNGARGPAIAKSISTKRTFSRLVIGQILFRARLPFYPYADPACWHCFVLCQTLPYLLSEVPKETLVGSSLIFCK